MRASIVRKRRTREHVIADLSINHVERQVLLCGYTVERVFYDYGYDLLMFTFNTNGEPEADEIRIQVKASDKLRVVQGGQAFALRVDRSDVARWTNERVLVVLILYDTQIDVAYWLDIKDYFRQLDGFNIFAAGKTITVYVPCTNRLDENAVRHLAAVKNQAFETQRTLL